MASLRGLGLGSAVPAASAYMQRIIRKGKGRYNSSWEPHLRATGRHLPYGITQCYLPPDTSGRDPPNLSRAGWYSIYIPRRDGRLSWPRWLNSARPEVEPATFRSRVRRRTAAPPRQPMYRAYASLSGKCEISMECNCNISMTYDAQDLLLYTCESLRRILHAVWTVPYN